MNLSLINAIDLGLPSGTLWADRNLGADNPEDFGDYYRWGETTPYTSVSPEYQFKKPADDIAGSEYDAATVLLGKNWHMPTFEQIDELIDCCKHEMTSINGVTGVRVTVLNGNSIFLPAAGCCYYETHSVGCTGLFGNCLSSTSGNANTVFCLDFFSNVLGWIRNNPANGYNIRPVMERRNK